MQQRVTLPQATVHLGGRIHHSVPAGMFYWPLREPTSWWRHLSAPKAHHRILPYLVKRDYAFIYIPPRQRKAHFQGGHPPTDIKLEVSAPIAGAVLDVLIPYMSNPTVARNRLEANLAQGRYVRATVHQNRPRLRALVSLGLFGEIPSPILAETPRQHMLF